MHNVNPAVLRDAREHLDIRWGRLVVVLGSGDELEAKLAKPVIKRSGMAENYDLVPPPLQCSSNLDGVQLAAPHVEIMRIYQDFHAEITSGAGRPIDLSS